MWYVKKHITKIILLTDHIVKYSFYKLYMQVALWFIIFSRKIVETQILAKFCNKCKYNVGILCLNRNQT